MIVVSSWDEIMWVDWWQKFEQLRQTSCNLWSRFRTISGVPTNPLLQTEEILWLFHTFVTPSSGIRSFSFVYLKFVVNTRSNSLLLFPVQCNLGISSKSALVYSLILRYLWANISKLCYHPNLERGTKVVLRKLMWSLCRCTVFVWVGFEWDLMRIGISKTPVEVIATMNKIHVFKYF